MSRSEDGNDEGKVTLSEAAAQLWRLAGKRVAGGAVRLLARETAGTAEAPKEPSLQVCQPPQPGRDAGRHQWKQLGFLLSPES